MATAYCDPKDYATKKDNKRKPSLLPFTLDLKVSCKNLIGKHSSSRLNFCVVFYSKLWKDHYEEVERTEIVRDSPNPVFTKTIAVEYHFEALQHMKVLVYDVDTSTENISDDDSVGQVEASLGQIVSNEVVSKPLTGVSGEDVLSSNITITVQQEKEGCDYACMNFQATDLENKDLLSKSDPFLEICRLRTKGNWEVIHRSEYVKDNLSPHWSPFTLPIRYLFGPGKDKPAKIRVYDWDWDGGHDLIGEFVCTVNDLTKALHSPVSWPVVNEEKRSSKKNYKDSGKVILNSVKICKKYTVLNYLLGGLQLRVTFGIDFTMTNLECENPASLHHIGRFRPNEYVQAIRALGTVLQDFDTTRNIPAYGFGAKIEPDATLSHDFPINFNLLNPNCGGVEGVLESYTSCRPKVKPFYPIEATPIMTRVIKLAQETKQQQPYKYHILVLMTSGQFSDWDQVKDCLVDASRLPMSVIIVGMGLAEFKEIEVCLGKRFQEITSTSGGRMARECVKFTRFRDAKRLTTDPQRTAEFFLSEIPHQVITYFEMMKIPPP